MIGPNVREWIEALRTCPHGEDSIVKLTVPGAHAGSFAREQCDACGAYRLVVPCGSPIEGWNRAELVSLLLEHVDQEEERERSYVRRRDTLSDEIAADVADTDRPPGAS